jgi:hypothetical protein
MSIDASSAPDQPSLVTDCHPQPLATSWAEDILPHTTSDICYHSGANAGPSGKALNSYNLPKPDGLAASAKWNICMACNQSYALPAGLGKHQRTGCESTRYWKCSLCQHQIFEKLGELHQHHLSIHGDTCFDCCNTADSSLSDHCKAFLSRCCIEIAKKAWGCPCCIDCSDTLRAWNKHKNSHRHQVQNEKVANWSFSTMVRSLLCHRDLLPASHKYNWSLCSWAHMKKNESQTLRFALERHVIPSNMFNNEIYSRLSMPESLVLHAFTLGTVGDTSVAPLNAIRCQTSMSAVLAYNNISIDQCSGVLPANLNFQQDSLERGHNSVSDESQQRHTSAFNMTPNEAADHEGVALFDIDSVEYKRATGVLQTRICDDQGYPRIRQGPEPLASCIPRLQNHTRVPLKHRQRARGRTPIRKDRVS